MSNLTEFQAQSVDTHLPEPAPLFSLACVYCDVDGFASEAEAVLNGWVDIEEDDGLGWTHLGFCPVCKDR